MKTISIKHVLTIGGIGFGDSEYEFNAPEGVAIDSSGCVYVSDTGNQTVKKYSREGKFLISYCKIPQESKEEPKESIVHAMIIQKSLFSDPTGLTIDENSNLYVCNAFMRSGWANCNILIFDKEGKLINKIGRMGENLGEFSKPFDIKLDSEGNMYISDWAYSRIQVFDKQFKLINVIGSEGNKEGEFKMQHGIAVNNDCLYVADTYNFRIQLFNKKGKHVKTLQFEGRPPYPMGLALTNNGNIVISRDDDKKSQHIIQIINNDGSILKSYGGIGIKNGEFRNPANIFVKDNILAVADKGNNRVQLFEINEL